MHVCVVSYKRCWRDEDSRWFSTGGFPMQMAAIGSLFDEMTLVVEQGRPRSGGIPLPLRARVVPLRGPVGQDFTRKLSVLWHLSYYLRNIRRHIREADVVHVPLPGDLPLLGFTVALLSRKRLLARYGGCWLPTSRTTVMERVTRTAMRLCAGGANIMMATGPSAPSPANGIQWIFSTALTQAELDESRPVLERRLSDPPRLVYIGRLSPEKGVANLIDALAVLRFEQFKPLPSVMLIGDGPELESLQATVKNLGFQDRIAFTHQLNRRQLSEKLRQADFCVQPSLTEGYSKAWLDAMCHGLPVLTTDVGAARAVVGREGLRGWLARPGDVGSLVSALRRALAEPIDWPDLRRRCRKFAETHTLERWAHEIGTLCAERWGMTLVDGKLDVRDLSG